MNFDGVPDRDCAIVDGASYVTTDDGEVHTIEILGYWDSDGVYHEGKPGKHWQATDTGKELNK